MSFYRGYTAKEKYNAEIYWVRQLGEDFKCDLWSFMDKHGVENKHLKDQVNHMLDVVDELYPLKEK